MYVTCSIGMRTVDGGGGGGGGRVAPPRQIKLTNYAAYNQYMKASFAHHLCAAHA